MAEPSGSPQERSQSKLKAKDIPPPGLTAWSVYSCLGSDRCRVPVTVKLRNGTCEVIAPDFIEMTWEETRRIRWVLRPQTYAGAIKDLRFSRSIEMDLDGDAWSSDDPDNMPQNERGRLFKDFKPNSPGKKMFLYGLSVQWKDSNDRWSDCDQIGPGIINRE